MSDDIGPVSHFSADVVSTGFHAKNFVGTNSTGARFVGGVASIAPTTGPFAVGDYVVSVTGTIFICTVAGNPGTWVQVQGNPETRTLATWTIASPSTGVQTAVYTIPVIANITGWSITMNAGTCTIDVLKQAYATTGVPGTSIVGTGTKPAVASGVAKVGGVSDWSGSLITAVNDQIAINITALATATSLEFALFGTV